MECIDINIDLNDEVRQAKGSPVRTGIYCQDDVGVSTKWTRSHVFIDHVNQGRVGDYSSTVLVGGGRGIDGRKRSGDGNDAENIVITSD